MDSAIFSSCQPNSQKKNHVNLWLRLLLSVLDVLILWSSYRLYADDANFLFVCFFFRFPVRREKKSQIFSLNLTSFRIVKAPLSSLSKWIDLKNPFQSHADYRRIIIRAFHQTENNNNNKKIILKMFQWDFLHLNFSLVVSDVCVWNALHMHPSVYISGLFEARPINVRKRMSRVKLNLA